MTKTFRYVLHSDVPRFAADGWIAHSSLNGTHHGEYSTLMEYAGSSTRESYTGAHVRSLAPHHAPYSDTRRDSLSLSASLALKLSQFAQAVFDVFALLFIFLFLSVTGVGIAFAFAVALFVRIP